MKKAHQKSRSTAVGHLPEPVSILGNKNVNQKNPNATENVAYLLQQIQKKGQIFVALEKNEQEESNMIYKEHKNPPDNNSGAVVFSKNGFVSVAKDQNQMTTFISNDDFIEEGVWFQILKEIPFVKKFPLMRFFNQWKAKMRQNTYDRKR